MNLNGRSGLRHAHGHRVSFFSEAERLELVELIGKQPDITLEELRSHFAKDCSLNAIHKLLKKNRLCC